MDSKFHSFILFCVFLLLLIQYNLSCPVGVLSKQSCQNACCCKYPNSVTPNMTIWSCFPTLNNVSGHEICSHLNGTCTGDSTCMVGESTPTSCNASVPCCCTYFQAPASYATLCLSSQLCSILSGSCN